MKNPFKKHQTSFYTFFFRFSEGYGSTYFDLRQVCYFEQNRSEKFFWVILKNGHKLAIPSDKFEKFEQAFKAIQ